MFGATVYLSQYFQLARGMSPTEAGLMSVAMVGGLLVSSIVSGRVISATGVWKRWLVGGLVLVVVGFSLLATIDADTPLVVVGLFMALVGIGLGATMQNLVLAVQNNTSLEDMGAASSVVAFFRSLGGSIGVSALGAILSTQVASTVREGLAAQGVTETGHQSHTIPDLSALPAPIRDLYEHAFGTAVGHIFLVAVPFAIIALVCVLFIREVPLRTTSSRRLRCPSPSRSDGVGAGRPGVAMTRAPERAESLRMLESEVGVLIRRVRRVIGERARALHPDLPASSYLMLTTVAQNGPLRASALAEQFDMDKGAISRQVRHLADLGLLDCTP